MAHLICIIYFDSFDSVSVRKLQSRCDGWMFALSKNAILLNLLSAQRLDNSSKRVYQKQRTYATNHADSRSGMKSIREVNFQCQLEWPFGANCDLLFLANQYWKPSFYVRWSSSGKKSLVSPVSGVAIADEHQLKLGTYQLSSSKSSTTL